MPEQRPPRSDDGFDRGFDAHRRRQATDGLELTPAERLRWLERTMEELRALHGRARDGKPMKPEPPAP